MISVSAGQLRELSERWKNFDIDQERARKEVKSANAADEETIRSLHERIARREEEFKEEWADLRVQIREDRDTAIKTLLKEGTPQAEVMRIMGNSNSQLLSRLYKEAMLELSEEGRVTASKGLVAVAEPDTQLEGVVWNSHLHTGVHGWLLSEDKMLYKRYDTSTEEAGEAEWYVATVEGNAFVAGSKEFFDRAVMSAVTKRLDMLSKLLEGSYAGKMNIKPSPFAA